MTTRYLSVETLKDYVRSELTLDDAFYEAAINFAELALDNACQRRFEVAGVIATARSFTIRNTDVVYIHDCTTITGIVDTGGTIYVTGTDYRAEPLNGLSDAGEPWPYYKLRRMSGAWWWSSYYPASPAPLLTVTATWGWPAIPAQIVEACKILAKDAFQQRDIRFGLVAVSEAGGVGTRENRIVRDAISTYAHPNTMVIA